MFAPDDAQRVFELLANVEAAKPGRDFIITVEKTDARSVTGQVVDRGSGELSLLVEDEPVNRAEGVPWDTIESITITSS
jgi:hypothetical protein